METMIKREDFIFALGYEGDVAVVDGRSRKKYRSHSALMLAEEGLFKAAACSAIYDDDTASLEKILGAYSDKTDSPLSSVAGLKRTLGVTAIPKGIKKVNVY